MRGGFVKFLPLFLPPTFFNKYKIFRIMPPAPVKPAVTMHRFLGKRVGVWLVNETSIRLEGVLKGYDEFYNLVLEDTTEIVPKSGETSQIGRVLLKGDTVGLVHPIGA